jgi:hypothetical protein
MMKFRFEMTIDECRRANADGGTFTDLKRSAV